MDLPKTLNSFRQFFQNDGAYVPTDLNPLFKIMNTIPVDTSECERGFSQMKLVSTDIRNKLNVDTISNLLFVKLNGPPLEFWDPKSYVINWLRNHYSAEANRPMNPVEEVSENEKNFYKLLN